MNREYVYSDLFKLLPQSSKVSKLEFVPDGKTPAYSSDTSNNGRVGFVDKEPSFKIKEETPVYLVFGDHTRTMNIVHENFCVMDNVKVLVPLVRMSDEVLLYITTCWKKAIPDLGYARHWSVAKKAKFELPVVESSNPDHKYTVDDIDYTYMQECIVKLEQERIAELEQERIAELDAYFVASGLSDYELTAADESVLSETPTMAGFMASTLFDIKKGKRLTKADMVVGDTPFVGSSSTNNGITAHIGNVEHLHPGNTFTVSYNGSVGEVFLQDETFWASDDVNVWYPKFEFNREAIQYIMAVVKKLGARHSYTVKWTIDKMREEKLFLPVVESPNLDHAYTPDDIDWGYMVRYIHAIEKLAIADVVKYRDRLIAATKQVVGV